MLIRVPVARQVASWLLLRWS